MSIRSPDWIPTMAGAPRDGSPVRVRVHGTVCELPWLLKWSDGCWRYCTTGLPVHSWHQPVAWNRTPRLAKETEYFDGEITRAYGSRLPPSQGNPRPTPKLVVSNHPQAQPSP